MYNSEYPDCVRSRANNASTPERSASTGDVSVWAARYILLMEWASHSYGDPSILHLSPHRRGAMLQETANESWRPGPSTSPKYRSGLSLWVGAFPIAGNRGASRYAKCSTRRFELAALHALRQARRQYRISPHAARTPNGTVAAFSIIGRCRVARRICPWCTSRGKRRPDQTNARYRVY